jgi:tRNA(fMet)-specific endonuclease VapC
MAVGGVGGPPPPPPRRAVRPMQIPEIQIAAVALALGNCTVITTDTDLSAVPGLSVENWADG